MSNLCYNLLGNFGRLGNVMFQYAATLGIARKTNMNPIAAISNVENFSTLFKLGSVTDAVVETNMLFNEESFCYDDRAFRIAVPENSSVDIRGYYQTPKYFSHIENEVKQNFDFNENIKNNAIDLIPSEPCVSVHVRRGDYVPISDYHFNQAIEYYENSIKHFSDYIPVFFSDDISWCKETFSHISNAVFVENKETLNLNARISSDVSGYVDMCAMSMCNAHVIANSSFSWWGAYLGGGPTIAPKTWFGPSGPQDWQDIYCDDWILA